ncbi:MAG: NADPH-dependent FMN reductase [Beijerinckiaceae bacterium]
MADRSLSFVTLLGSLRKGSLNRVVANALPALAPAGVKITALPSVGDLPHYNADVQAEGMPQLVRQFGDAIKQADGVIIVTPEYNYSVPGVLKNAIDWISRLPDTPFAGKPIAIMSASPSILGGARAHYHLRQMMVFLDALVLNKPEIIITFAASKLDVEKGKITDDATRDLVTKQIEALAIFARRFSAGADQG